MELRQVRYFVAAAEQLHFSRAAESMHVVQPAISQQIKRLEEELCTKLFERTGNEVRLTEAGRQMLPECRKLLCQAEETMRVAKAANAGLRGRITFGFVDNSIRALLPPLVRIFRAQYPEVELGLQSLNRIEQAVALQERRIDIGLMPGPAPQQGFLSETFVSDSLVAAMPVTHPLAMHPSLTLDMLKDQPFVMFPASMRTRILEIVLAACALAGFTPRVVQEATQMDTLLALVDAGLGITLVPKWVANGSVYDVVFRPLDNPALIYELLFAWRQDFANPALAGFLEVARKVAQNSVSVHRYESAVTPTSPTIGHGATQLPVA
jgi:DNA-binding transcriptional LysR family regulator